MQEKENYKEYLVRKVKEEIGKIFEQKMDEAKNEILNIEYKTVLHNTEEILKNYKKLIEHIKLANDKDNILIETREYYNKEIESIMTGIFSEEEVYLESLLKSRYKTKMLLDFIDKVFNYYLQIKTDDKIEIRKKKILQEIYINGVKQSKFIYDNYDTERTFYTDKEKLIKDLAPLFFGVKGINI